MFLFQVYQIKQNWIKPSGLHKFGVIILCRLHCITKLTDHHLHNTDFIIKFSCEMSQPSLNEGHIRMARGWTTLGAKMSEND